MAVSLISFFLIKSINEKEGTKMMIDENNIILIINECKTVMGGGYYGK